MLVVVIRPPAPEPLAGPWRGCSVGQVVHELLGDEFAPGPRVLAVDGRSGSGKSTLADRIASVVDGSAVVRSDDVAWWESFFDWDRLMVDGVLEPFRRGRQVRFRPPAWERRERAGAIEVPASVTLLVVEGVGVSRRSMMAWVDAAIWVQSDPAEARRRGIERDGGTDEAVAFWDEWDAEERAFLAADRPWERADLVVCGTPDLVRPQVGDGSDLLVAPAPSS